MKWVHPPPLLFPSPKTTISLLPCFIVSCSSYITATTPPKLNPPNQMWADPFAFPSSGSLYLLLQRSPSPCPALLSSAIAAIFASAAPSPCPLDPPHRGISITFIPLLELEDPFWPSKLGGRKALLEPRPLGLFVVRIGVNGGLLLVGQRPRRLSSWIRGKVGATGVCRIGHSKVGGLGGLLIMTTRKMSLMERVILGSNWWVISSLFFGVRIKTVLFFLAFGVSDWFSGLMWVLVSFVWSTFMFQ